MEGVGPEIVFGEGERKDCFRPLNSIKQGEGCRGGIVGAPQQQRWLCRLHLRHAAECGDVAVALERGATAVGKTLVAATAAKVD